MREILFRGKRIDNGEWVGSGNLIHFNEENEHYIPDPNNKCLCRHDEADNIIEWRNTLFYKVIPETVGQYTGLTDKNGKKIFEGDIVKHYNDNAHPENYATYQVEWYAEKATFIVVVIGKCERYEMRKGLKYEIIGNIHDNPELMKGE